MMKLIVFLILSYRPTLISVWLHKCKNMVTRHSSVCERGLTASHSVSIRIVVVLMASATSFEFVENSFKYLLREVANYRMAHLQSVDGWIASLVSGVLGEPTRRRTRQTTQPE